MKVNSIALVLCITLLSVQTSATTRLRNDDNEIMRKLEDDEVSADQPTLYYDEGHTESTTTDTATTTQQASPSLEEEEIIEVGPTSTEPIPTDAEITDATDVEPPEEVTGMETADPSATAAPSDTIIIDEIIVTGAPSSDGTMEITAAPSDETIDDGSTSVTGQLPGVDGEVTEAPADVTPPTNPPATSDTSSTVKSIVDTSIGWHMGMLLIFIFFYS